MVKGLLIYFITKGPEPFFTHDGYRIFRVEAQVSNDGKTVQPMVFSFEAEEQAINFKRAVNYKMEPTTLGEEE